MPKKITKQMKRLPIIIEENEDNMFIAECPVFEGCYTQGETLSEVMENIREVISMCLEEKENKEILKNYKIANLCFSEIIV
jgi:predicted RNase H-like HicB family nuclease